jgi:DNA-binding transcriptional ArsR family regulator
MAVPGRRMSLTSVCRALGSPIRLRALRRMLEVGQPMSVSQLASRERQSADAMSRHLQVLEHAGVVASHPGVDRRCTCYFVPAKWRKGEDELDFGCCAVRLGYG